MIMGMQTGQSSRKEARAGIPTDVPVTEMTGRSSSSHRSVQTGGDHHLPGHGSITGLGSSKHAGAGSWCLQLCCSSFLKQHACLALQLFTWQSLLCCWTGCWLSRAGVSSRWLHCALLHNMNCSALISWQRPGMLQTNL